MPLPTGFDTKITLLTATPIADTDINSILTTQNAAGYACGAITFVDDDNALLFFTRAGDAPLDQVIPQRVAEVAMTQLALNAEKAAQEADGYYTTSVFVVPVSGTVFVMYSGFNAAP
jgi:hypothetical protein